MLNLSQHERDFMFMKLYLETKVVDKVNLDKLFEIFDDGTSRALSPNKRKTLILLKSKLRSPPTLILTQLQANQPKRCRQALRPLRTPLSDKPVCVSASFVRLCDFSRSKVFSEIFSVSRPFWGELNSPCTRTETQIILRLLSADSSRNEESKIKRCASQKLA